MSISITRRGLLVSTATLAAGSAMWAVGPVLGQGQDDRAIGRTHHALLIAVTAYPELPPRASLVGPNNDAELVREFLLNNAPVRFEPENVTVLADDLEPATAAPTRENIRQKMAELAGKVENGDFVYLHFSGHGAQQPAMEPENEIDGMDEIFLPRDTMPWIDREAGVPNAYIDKEIRDDLQAIRDKGAFVWAVFDCCHSGTMTRAADMFDQDSTDRKIEFSDLGIPEEAVRAARAEAEPATRGMGADTARPNPLGFVADVEKTGAESMAPGGMVAFFAAQTVETTPEMLLPRNVEDARKLGLFTFTLFSKIAENPSTTYRQLGQSILQAYSADNRQRPTPLFEGDLDRYVFGSADAARVSQWPIKLDGMTAEIPAGQLHRLSRGAKLAVVASPAAATEEALGYVEVLTATNLSSQLIPLRSQEAVAASSAGLAPIRIADIPPGAFARLVELSIQFELAVALPSEETDYPDETAMVMGILQRIVDEKAVPVNLRLVGARDAADLRLAILSEMDVGILIEERNKAQGIEVASRAALSTQPRLWLLPPSADLSLEVGLRPPSLPLGDESEEAVARVLAENLVSIYRATNLSRLSAASDYQPEEVEIGFNLLRIETGELQPMAAGAVPVLMPDDQVHLEGRNGSARPVDINVLFIGSDYSITHMYAERLQSGNEVRRPLFRITDSSFGIERVIVVLTEAAPQTGVEDLSFLAQPGVRNATRSAMPGDGGFGSLLADLADAPETRSAALIGASNAKKGAVMIFPLETAPRG